MKKMAMIQLDLTAATSAFIRPSKFGSLAERWRSALSLSFRFYTIEKDFFTRKDDNTPDQWSVVPFRQLGFFVRSLLSPPLLSLPACYLLAQVILGPTTFSEKCLQLGKHSRLRKNKIK